MRLANHLLALAQDGRDARRSADGTPVDVLLEEVAGLYGTMAAGRGVRVELEPGADGDAPGDLGQLLLVVGNLLENALWHTPSGGLVRLRSSRAGNELVLEIIDEGPGLPAEELGRVFERFYRAPSAHDGGSGLGLATARAVAERLGGSVTLENRTDRTGLVARAVLPGAEPKRAPAAP